MSFLLALVGLITAEPIKVAVIDTGLNLRDERFSGLLCKEGHRDFSGEGLTDYHGHGTHVAGTIKAYAGAANYCLVIVKFYKMRGSAHENALAMSRAISYVSRIGVQVVNVSGGGEDFNEFEYLAISQSPKTLFVAAAGNGTKEDPAHELVVGHCYFPACYPLRNVVSVGALDWNGRKLRTSNFGRRVKAWEVGENIRSTLPNNQYGYLSGTSMATAVHTGKLLRAYFRASR